VSAKVPLTVKLATGEKQVEAYLTETNGLVVHRVYVYQPGQDDHKETSLWTITHAPSGLGLLGPDRYQTTMAAAKSLAKSLGEAMDWSGSADTLDPKAVFAAVENITVSGVDVPVPIKQGRFVIRRARGKGYEVVDSETDEVIETIPHRGLAATKARELNEVG
jgi:hypothetical protein